MYVTNMSLRIVTILEYDTTNSGTIFQLIDNSRLFTIIYDILYFFYFALAYFHQILKCIRFVFKI